MPVNTIREALSMALRPACRIWNSGIAHGGQLFHEPIGQEFWFGRFGREQAVARSRYISLNRPLLIARIRCGYRATERQGAVHDRRWNYTESS